MNKVAAVLLLGSASLGIAVTSPASPSPRKITAQSANGQRLFAQYCAACHDTRGNMPKSGPALKSYYRTHQPHPSDAAVRSIIQQGKGKMPAFSTLNQSQTADLIAFLKTL
ncbi:MAG TPA: cytochrome c [Acidobacteriaceae bacterium]